MSMTAPFVVKSGDSSHSNTNRSSNGASSSNATTRFSVGPSREMTGNRLFQFYMESFFKIPKDMKNDIICCQRALKAHIKVHQMVLDVFQQQPNADHQQMKRILDELETEIYEINAEQSFLFLRLRRIIDEFYKMLKKNNIPTDTNATNEIVSKEIVPFIGDTNIEFMPVSVMPRLTEDKLIEKYFEVQKETPMEIPQPMEIIDLDDDGVSSVPERIVKSQQSKRSLQKRENSTSKTYNAANGESLLRNLPTAFPQPSLLKPMNQRGSLDIDDKSRIGGNSNILSKMYGQQPKLEENKDSAEKPVSTNVRMSRLNLRQALKRAQAAVWGPAVILPPPPPPPPPPPKQQQHVVTNQPTIKMSVAKNRATRAAAAATAAALAANKSPENTSSSGEGTPERGGTPPHAYWPDELEETRTKAEEYGQEMFLRFFDLFTPEVHAQMQQRRSKRRRRCVQNQNYHYGGSAASSNEPEAKKKRKAFLLSPQVKKALPNKRNKRRSADNTLECNSVPPSRSASSSPDDKRACNECFKGGYILETCETCKQDYHPQCHNEKDESLQHASRHDPKLILSEPKICPTCKRNSDNLIKKETMINKELHVTAQETQKKISMEKERRQNLLNSGEAHKTQMNKLFKIVRYIHNTANKASKPANNTSTNKTTTISNNTTAKDCVIHLD